MACQKLCKQGRDKAKVNILAKVHPYIFFTLQLDSACYIKLLGRIISNAFTVSVDKHFDTLNQHC